MRQRATRGTSLGAGRLLGLPNGLVLAQEAGTFGLAYPTQVRFGADSRWSTATIPAGSGITCQVGNFGGVDPAEGVAKQCIVGPYVPAESEVLAIFAKYNGQGAKTVWYDLSDKSKLFQDSAGTTPVTASGQPIGRILDKSGGSTLYPAAQATTTSRALYTEAGGLVYALFDGSDDSWQSTVSIDLTGTDKVTVVAGARKMSDAAVGVIAEFGTSSSGIAGTFGLYAPDVNAATRLSSYARGAGATTISTKTDAAAPFAAVATQQIDLAAPSNALRVNGVASPTMTGALGGSFINAMMNIGRRNGASLPLNGYMSGYMFIGAKITDSERGVLEAYTASKMGLVL